MTATTLSDLSGLTGDDGTPRRTVSRRNIGLIGSTPEGQIALQAQANQRGRAIVRCSSTMFQLSAEKQVLHPNGYVERLPERNLTFNAAGYATVSDEELATVEAILRGEHSDGQVDANHFLTMARGSQLQVIYPGMVSAPIATWDQLPSAMVVSAALAVGELTTPSKIDDAIAYEEQAPKRAEPREVRTELVEQLKLLREAMVLTPGSVPSPAEAAANVADNPFVGHPASSGIGPNNEGVTETIVNPGDPQDVADRQAAEALRDAPLLPGGGLVPPPDAGNGPSTPDPMTLGVNSQMLSEQQSTALADIAATTDDGGASSGDQGSSGTAKAASSSSDDAGAKSEAPAKAPAAKASTTSKSASDKSSSSKGSSK